MSETLRILAVDGGGFRGAYSAHLLNRIEKEFSINWLESFALMAGTSTGSIVVAGLACRLSAADIYSFYEEYGKDIFKKRLLYRGGIMASRYRNKELRRQLDQIFGNKKLGEIDIPLIIPAVDIGNGCVHVFKSNYHGEFLRDKDVFVKDAVIASCSAPTYFDPYHVDSYMLADGGLWANCPSLVAAIDAKKRLGADLDKIKVLSIGTGISRKFYSQKNLCWKKRFGWGILSRWGGPRFIDMLLNLQSQTANNMLGLLIKREQLLRINFESDRRLPLDDVGMLNDWVSKADHDFTHRSAEIKKFLEI